MTTGPGAVRSAETTTAPPKPGLPSRHETWLHSDSRGRRGACRRLQLAQRVQCSAGPGGEPATRRRGRCIPDAQRWVYGAGQSHTDDPRDSKRAQLLRCAVPRLYGFIGDDQPGIVDRSRRPRRHVGTRVLPSGPTRGDGSLPRGLDHAICGGRLRPGLAVFPRPGRWLQAVSPVRDRERDADESGGDSYLALAGDRPGAVRCGNRELR